MKWRCWVGDNFECWIEAHTPILAAEEAAGKWYEQTGNTPIDEHYIVMNVNCEAAPDFVMCIRVHCKMQQVAHLQLSWDATVARMTKKTEKV